MMGSVQRFSMNTAGRDFVVGDIHGCFTELCREMDRVCFNPKVDRIFSVGDLVDRGPESIDVEDWLRQKWFHAVRGNHEDMAIMSAADAIPVHAYAANGGQWFISLPKERKHRIALALADLPLVFEVETPTGLVGIVHAEPIGYDWATFTAAVAAGDDHVTSQAMWGRRRIKAGDATPVVGIHRVYVGHTIVKDVQILGNVHYIDTGACTGRPLTMLQIAGGD